MKILDNDINEIKKIVELKAKYQKVMLIYDNETSEAEICEIYEQIKGLCIFNKIEIGEDCKEIYNGYKLLIFCARANAFIKFNYDIEEFVSVFIQRDEAIIPFFLNANCYISSSERYLLAKQNFIDTNAISSLYFNKFYNYVNDLLYFQTSNINFTFNEKEITQFNTIESLQQLDRSIQFIDVKIAKETGLSYKELNKLHFLLICAFLSIIVAVDAQTLELVDVYKFAKDDLDLTDKFYALQTNQAIVRLVQLNYNFLFNACVKTKEKILALIQFTNEEEILNLINLLKNYAQKSDNLITYLYLYNVFGN